MRLPPRSKWAAARRALRPRCRRTAAKALEYLDDERSVTDVLAVAHRAVDRGDEERALLALSAVAHLLPPDGVPLVRLGDRARSRGLHDVVHAVARELQRSDVPVPTQWAEALEEDGRLLHPVHEVLCETFVRILTASARGSRIMGVATGFDAYDRLTGGLRDGELTVLAGRPGVGTTSLAISIALTVSSPVELENADNPGESWQEQGLGVLVFSLGKSRLQTVHRTLCSGARVDPGAVHTGAFVASDWRRITLEAARPATLPIWVNDTPDLSVRDIRSIAGRHQAEFDVIDPATGRQTQRLGLIVIDDCDLLRGERRVLHSAKAIARDLMVPILATIALPAGSDDRDGGTRPQHSDLPLSDDDADNVCFIHRDGYHDPDADPNAAELIVASQRNGPPGTVRLRWESRFGCFESLSEDEPDG